MKPTKRLIILCDGTWQSSDGSKNEVPTNITRIARALRGTAKDGTPQIVYYQSGVGTGGTIDKLVGGGTGRGLSEHVREAYGYIAHNYSPGDTIHLFGFSRGAFTARSICGLICRLGLLTKRGMDHFYEIYGDWVARRASTEKIMADWGPDSVRADVVVTTIGCFDTVGSLGIPQLPIPLLGSMISGLSSEKDGLHDTDLSEKVLHAFHALALDEERSPFAPTLWKKTPDNKVTELRQCWFPGVHTNVGGGYEDQGIANMTLAWMIERTREWLDYDFDYLMDTIIKRRVKNWGEGTVYDSRTGIMKLTRRLLRTPGQPQYDEKEPNVRHDTGECVHVSVRVKKILKGNNDWIGGALKDWTWDERSEKKRWCPPDALRKVGVDELKEDWFGDVEKLLAGTYVVEKLLGWEFPKQYLAMGHNEKSQVEEKISEKNGEY